MLNRKYGTRFNFASSFKPSCQSQVLVNFSSNVERNIDYNVTFVSRISLTPLSKIIINDYSYKLPFRLETFPSSLGDFMILYTVTYDNLKHDVKQIYLTLNKVIKNAKKKRKKKKTNFY